MTIQSADSKRFVDVGNSDVLLSLYSTILMRIDKKTDIQLAIEFLRTGDCNTENALECARQMNLIRDRLSQISPDNAVYNFKDLTKKAPWSGNLSPTITSCANLYLTADGKDLLFELVSILTYSYYKHSPICIV